MIILEKYNGRSGNLLFMEVAQSILSKKLNLYVKSEFPYEIYFKKLGFSAYRGSTRIINDILHYDDSQMADLLNLEKINNGISYNGYFQVKDFVINYKDDIRSHFNLNYQNKRDDMFVHLRLDDAAQWNVGIDYYRKAIESCNYNKGYISSDSPNSQIVNDLISEYKLELVNTDPITTIDYAKNFGNLVLSKGTFSWWIGFLSMAKNIYYPKEYKLWHGDIFVYDEWQEIEL